MDKHEIELCRNLIDEANSKLYTELLHRIDQLQECRDDYCNLCKRQKIYSTKWCEECKWSNIE